jgi:hypothetical protein
VLNTRITRGAVIRGTIKYPPAAGLGNFDTGMLVVAKAVLWCELPDWVLTYGAGKGSDDFPHDKTSDQWFNEAQFATYTEIGRCIAKKAREVRPRDEETPAPDGSVGRLPEALEVGTSLRGHPSGCRSVLGEGAGDHLIECGGQGGDLVARSGDGAAEVPVHDRRRRGPGRAAAR